MPRDRDSSSIRPSPHPLEFAVAILVGLNLCFLPWAFGGVDLWSQLASAGFGALALGCALLPRRGPGRAVGGGHADHRTWPRLARFPVFWAGVLLLAYVGIQALNPAFDHHVSATEWWLTPRFRVPWLPAGMNIPFTDAGPWRTMLLWFCPWCVMCAVWLGITRRSVVIGLLTVVSANGFGLAAFGLVQRAGSSSNIYGLRAVPSGDFFAGFIYKNHAAAYFNLLATMAAGLAVHTFWRNRRRAGRHGPAILHFLFAVTMMLAVVLTGSLSGVTLLAATLLMLVPLTTVRLLRAFPAPTGLDPGLLLAILLVLLMGVCGAAAGYTRLRERIEVKVSGEGYQSAHSRLLAARQGIAMFDDRWLFGWGAGCFRYGFTKYQHQVPELTEAGGTRYFWEHVHNDWLELLIELGLVGILPVAFILGFWIRQAGRQRIWEHPARVWILSTLGALAAYSLLDFPLQNPAILVTAGALPPLLFRWNEADS